MSEWKPWHHARTGRIKWGWKFGRYRIGTHRGPGSLRVVSLGFVIIRCLVVSKAAS